MLFKYFWPWREINQLTTFRVHDNKTCWGKLSLLAARRLGTDSVSRKATKLFCCFPWQVNLSARKTSVDRTNTRDRLSALSLIFAVLFNYRRYREGRLKVFIKSYRRVTFPTELLTVGTRTLKSRQQLNLKLKKY